MFKFKNSRILLFAREPLPGRVKTRLHGVMSPEQVLALYQALLRYQVEKLSRWHLAPIELWVEGDTRNPLLQEFANQARLLTQQGEDLGQRMAHAAGSALESADSVVLIGVDCPSIDRDYLDSALQQLADGRQVVIGPAEDGGYVLLGLNRVWPELFARIDWGTAGVLPQARAAIRELGLDSRELAVRWDLDRPEDLERLASLEPPLTF